MNAKIWGRWLARLFKQAPKGARRRTRPLSRLSFESLEDRLTPTTYTWTGLGGSSNWNVAANWSSSAGGAAAPSTVAGADNNLVFGALGVGASKPTNNNFTGLIVDTITFSANPSFLSTYNLGGNAFTLTGGIVLGANLGTEIISANLTLTPPTTTAQETITVPSASTLDISGTITSKEPAVGAVSATVESALETLTKTGAGTLQLDGNNSNYTGAITIANSGGILAITNSDALGLGNTVAGAPNSGITTINTSSQLQLKGTAAAIAVPEQLIINGTGISNDGALLNASNNNVWAGPITMDSNSTFGANANTSMSITGQISDVGSGFNLSKAGQGRVIFSRVGGNTYRGQTIVNNGILEIEDPLSLGAGANIATKQSGSPQSETIVNYDPTSGIAGTLEINFDGTLGTTDPNGILTNPNAAYNAKTNPYVGFQVFNDILVLNGPGFNPTSPGIVNSGNIGALLNANGNNAWDGSVVLGMPSNLPNTGNVSIAVNADSTTSPNTNLTISGVISTASPLPAPVPNVLKIGNGVLILNDTNTFDGNVYIEQGAINVGDSGALGSSNTNKVFVGYYPPPPAFPNATPAPTGLSAALQLQVDSGYDGTMANGVLENTHYRNLGFDSVNGAGPGQELDVTGTSGTFTLSVTTYTSTGLGITYTTGSLNIASPTFASDLTTAVTKLLNSAGFAATGNVNVTEDIAGSGSGNIYRINFTGALNDANIPLMTSSLAAVAVNPIYALTVSNTIEITGTGFTSGLGVPSDGALDSISGVNTYTGPISLGAGLTNTTSIGVDADTRTGHFLADTNYLADDYSLTITGNGTTSGIVSGSAGTTLDKFGLGDLILPTANEYTGPTDVQAGWVTVQNNESLGIPQNLTQTLQSPTTVATGAAVMLDPQSSFITLSNNFILNGDGITPSTKAPIVPNVYGLLNQEGAIENENGSNILTGIIQLNGVVGIGVEQVFAPTTATPTSQLTVLGTMEDGSSSGSLTKLGSRRLILAGPGTYTGNVNISQGVILLQNSTGLGEGNLSSPPTVTVNSGTALEVANTVTSIGVSNPIGGNTYASSLSGGVQEGVEVWGENLILNGAGDPTFNDTALTVLSNNAVQTGPEVQTVAVSPAGSFTLTYGGYTTTALTTNSTAAAVEAALNALTSISSFSGAYATVLQNGNVYEITITNPTDTAQAVTATPVVASGTGNAAQADVGTTEAGSTNEMLAPLNDQLVSTDNIWEGPVTLNSDISVTVPTDSRFIMAGTVLNGTGAGAAGSNLTFTGGGELDLDGSNTYTGTTFIDQGVVTLGSSTGLGAAGSPEVQSILLQSIPVGQKYTLTYTNLLGETDNPVTLTYTGSPSADDAAIEAALDALPGIGGGSDSGGTVIATETIATVKPGTFNVTISLTFGGTLSGFPQNLVNVVVGTGGTSYPATLVQAGQGGTIVANGASLQLAGSITVSGEPLLIQGNGSLNDTQTLTVPSTSGTYNLSYTGPNSSGVTVTDTVGPFSPATTALDIQNALNSPSFTNIGGVGGVATVTLSGDVYTIVLGGTLAGQSLQTMTVTPLSAGTVPTIVTTQVGSTSVENIPTQWFQVGPNTISGGQTAGKQAVAGSVTAIAADPNDPNTIYIATNGGGVWKTINGGANWYPIFDSIPEIQTVTVNTAGSFTLSFGGYTTTALSGSDSNLALDMEAALDALPSIGGSGALVTVFQNAANSFQVTFDGQFAGVSEALLSTNILNGTVKISTLETGANPSFAMYVGAIAINPNFPNVIYVGTGVTDNATDSFYGTGIYESTNAGVTWTLLQNNTTSNPGVAANPFNGRGVSAMVVDPKTNDLIVADGDSTAGQDEVQTIDMFAGEQGIPSPFTLSLTAMDTTGAVVTDTTTGIPIYGAGQTYTDPITGIVYSGELATCDQVQFELNQFSNVGGVGGYVVVAPTTPQAGAFEAFTITFEGYLSETTLPALVTNWPLPYPPPTSIGVLVSTVAGTTTVVNGTTGTSNSPPGIWRFTPNSGTATTGIWENLTDVVSVSRGSVASGNGADPIYGPNGSMPGEPNTPGPEDNYQIYFPQSNATWSDLQIVTNSSNQQVLYAALGSSEIGTQSSPAASPTPVGTPADGVFWSTDFNGPVEGVDWYQGNPWVNTLPNSVYTPDNEASDMFPSPFYVDLNSGKAPENGNIKISVVTGGTYSDEPGPSVGYFGIGSNDGFATIYASVATAGGALQGIYVSTDGGVNWAAVGTLPSQFYLSSEGQYDNAILATSDTTVYVGGEVSTDVSGQTGQIYESKDGGNTWTDISVENNVGPHEGQHAIVVDGNNVLFGNDGGIWQFNPTATSWNDVNGNLANSEVSSIATSPTNIAGIATSPPTVTAVAAVQSNGTAGFENGQQWAELDASAGGEMSGSQVFVDPVNPNVIYEVQTQTGGSTDGSGAIVRESSNDGSTWNTILAYPTITSQVVPLEMDQINPERLVVGGTTTSSQFYQGLFDGTGEPAGLYVTTDATDGTPVWTNIAINNNTGAPTLPTSVTQITAIGLAEYQGTFVTDGSFPDVTDQGANAYVPNTIYITDGSRVFLTKDGGSTWVERDTGLSGSIQQLVVDPRNENTVYAVMNGFNQGGVWVSYNAGTSWTQIGTANGLPNVPAWSLALDARNNNLFVGTDTGVYELAGGGATGAGTWQVFGTGMPNVQVHDVVLNPITNTLYAATYGRGVFELMLDNAQTAASPISTSAGTGLSGPSVWGGNVILTSDTTFGADGAQNLPNGISTGSIDFVGTIQDMIANADPTVTKVGGGDVIFSGANTYGGLTVVQQGNLVVDNSQALGADSAGSADGTVVDQGASLELESNLDSEAVTVNGDGGTFNDHYQGSLRNISGDNTYSGNVTFGTDNPNATITFGADSGSELTMTGVVSGPSTISLVKEGTGTIALAGDNTYTGSTYIYQGAIQAQNDGALGAGTTGVQVVVLDGAQLQLQTPTGGTPVTITGLPLLLSGTGIFGTGALLNTGGSNTWAGSITLALLPGFSADTLPSSDVSIGSNAGDTLTLAGPVGELQVNGQNGNGNGFQTVGQESGINKVGAGTVVLQNPHNSPNTFSGGVTVSDGNLVVGDSGALGQHPTVDPTLATVQQVVTLSNDRVGSFQLSFDGATTTMSYGTTAANMENMLDSGIGLFAKAGFVGVNVTVVKSPIETTTQNLPTSLTNTTGNLYTITFGGSLTDTAIPLTATGSNGTVAGASFVTHGGEDVEVDSGAELDINNANAAATPIDVVGHTVGLNGSGLSGNGALQNTFGDNTWNGPIVEETGPTSYGTTNTTPSRNASIGATEGTSLTLQGQISVDLFNSVALPLTVGGAGSGGAGTLIVPAGTSFQTFTLNNVNYTSQTIVTGGTLQVDGTLGNIDLASGAIGGTGSVGTIVDLGSVGGIVNPGDNGDSTLANGSLTYPVESANTNAVGTLTSTGVTLSKHDTYDAYFGNPAQPNSSDLLQVNGAIALNSATLSGYINPDVLIGNSTTIIETDYNNGANPNDTVSGTFTDQNPNGSTPTDSGAGILATTIAYIDNEKFDVDYYIDHVTITRVPEVVTLSTITISTPLGAPSSPVYGEDVQATVTLIPEVNSVVLTGSTLEFQITDPLGNNYLYQETVTASGNNVYSATIDLPESLLVPLSETLLPAPALDYTVSALYEGQVSDGAQLFSPVSDGVVISDPTATEVHPATTFTVAPANTTTTLSVAPTASNSTYSYGTALTFTATVQSTLPVADQPPGESALVLPPEGTVEFFDNVAGTQTPIGFGTLSTTGGITTATFTTTSLSVGNHSITATYEANGIPDNYYSSNSNASPVPLLVTQVASTMTLTASNNSSIPYNGQITFTATVIPPLGNQGLPTGTVTFQDGTTVLGTAQLFTVGGTTSAKFTTAAFQIPADFGASQTITAFYSGDGNFEPSSATTSITVTQIATSTSLATSGSPSTAGQNVTFTATIAPSTSGGANPTGTVIFQITNGTQTITGSAPLSTLFGVTTATFTTNQIAAGTSNKVTATYSGDGNYQTSNDSLTQQVSTSTSTTTLSATPTTAVANQAVTLTAKVTGPTGGAAFGTVTFHAGTSASGPIVGTATLNSNGVGSVQVIPGGPVGTHNFIAVFTDSTNSFSTSTSNVSAVNVVANGTRASKVTLVSSLDPSTVGASVTFTATVKDAGTGAVQTPSGTVAFKDATTGVILGYGALSTTGGVTSATLTTSNFQLGNNSIVATYSGSTLFALAASPALIQMVDGIETSSVQLVSSINPSSYGQGVTFTATVTNTNGTMDTPTGKVTFVLTNSTTNATYTGTGTLAASKTTGVATATFSTTSLTSLLPVGSYSVVATYSGDNNFLTGSKGTLTQTVNQEASTTTLTGGPASQSSVYGQLVTYVATVTPAFAAGVPTGTVTFYANGTALATVNVVTSKTKVVTATYATKVLAPNAYTITAVYNGDSNVQTSTSNGLSLTVNQDTAKIALAPSTTTSNTPVTFTTTISAVAPSTGIPTGSVIFTIDGIYEGTVNLTATGKAALTLPGGLTAGNHTIVVMYSGDNNFAAVTKSFVYDFVQGRQT